VISIFGRQLLSAFSWNDGPAIATKQLLVSHHFLLDDMALSAESVIWQDASTNA